MRISQKRRATYFERFGETAIINVITSGMGQRNKELEIIYNNENRMREHAAEWLTERGDLRELREQRLETVEWAILIFAVLGVIMDLIRVLAR